MANRDLDRLKRAPVSARIEDKTAVKDNDESRLSGRRLANVAPSPGQPGVLGAVLLGLGLTVLGH